MYGVDAKALAMVATASKMAAAVRITRLVSTSEMPGGALQVQGREREHLSEAGVHEDHGC